MRRHLLFVDDDPAILDGIRRLLHAFADDWELHFASNGREALDVLARAPIDVVTTDVQMPEMDGFALLVAVLGDERTAALPVVMLTGVGDDELKQRALNMGATDLLTKPVQRAELIARLNSALRVKRANDSLRVRNDELEARVVDRTRELADSRLDIIWSLASAAAERDRITGHHVIRVGLYSAIVAEALGLRGDFVDRITLAAPLHDIGKIGTPDTILAKAGPLTPAERVVMQEHCRIGAAILEPERGAAPLHRAWRERAMGIVGARADNPILSMAAGIARSHHERWDGNGYPDRLGQEAIPLAARIVSVVDVFDALISERHYKPAFSEERTLQIMGAGVGSQFDPAIWTAFSARLADVRTTNERWGTGADTLGRAA
jgi:putative two-component system response regulator